MVELLIVMAIVAILAAVGYPSYVRYIARGNRSAAESFMLEVASRQERYLVDARQYAPDLATLSMIPPSSVSPNYTVTITGVTATPPAYVIQAVPIGVQLTNDTACGSLTIDSAGAKGASGASGAIACWNR
jgi:type IV pilus assembly protein PilE